MKPPDWHVYCLARDRGVKKWFQPGGVIHWSLYRRNAGGGLAGLLAGYLGVAADTEHHHGMMLDADAAADYRSG